MASSEKIWTILDVLNWASDRFTQKGIETARLDAQILLGETLGLSKVQLYTSFDKPLSAIERATFKEKIIRRSNREPIAYILGKKDFWNHSFHVSPAVLIPRPDTELLIEEGIVAIKEGTPNPTILDIGTGSGCIAISLKKEFTEAQVIAVDISKEALDIARKNAKEIDVDLQFIHSDISTEIPDQSIDYLFSNPPYITKNEIEQIQPEINKFEPTLALLASNEGMLTYEKILMDSARVLKPGGKVFLEIGDGREKDLVDLAKNYFYHTTVKNDLAGLPRLLILSDHKSQNKEQV